MQILRELSPECAIISISALHNRGITEFRKCLSKGKTNLHRRLLRRWKIHPGQYPAGG